MNSCPLTGPHKDCVDVTYVDHGGVEVTQAYPSLSDAEDSLRYRGVEKGRIKRVTRLHGEFAGRVGPGAYCKYREDCLRSSNCESWMRDLTGCEAEALEAEK